MSHLTRNRNQARAFGLVEILVVIVIIALLALFLLPRLTGGKDPVTGERAKAPVQRAREVAGNAYIGQINQAIQMYKMDNDNRNPSALSELKKYGLTDEMLLDPNTRQPLPYNAATGQVGNGFNRGTPPGGVGTNLPNVGALPGGGAAGLNQ